MVLYIYSFFFLVFKGQQIQTVLNTTSKYNFPMKAATVQHVRSHSHPLPPAQASWQRQLLLKNKIHIFNISSSKSYHVSAQNNWVRQTRPALKNTGDRHGNEPAALEPLGFPWLRAAAGTNSPGGAEVRTGTNRNNQELEDLLLQGQVRAHFPCSPSTVAPITLSCPFPACRCPRLWLLGKTWWRRAAGAVQSYPARPRSAKNIASMTEVNLPSTVNRPVDNLSAGSATQGKMKAAGPHILLQQEMLQEHADTSPSPLRAGSCHHPGAATQPSGGVTSRHTLPMHPVHTTIPKILAGARFYSPAFEELFLFINILLICNVIYYFLWAH